MGWIIALIVFLGVGLGIIAAIRPMTGRKELATKRDWNLALALAVWAMSGGFALRVFMETN